MKRISDYINESSINITVSFVKEGNGFNMVVTNITDPETEMAVGNILGIGKSDKYSLWSRSMKDLTPYLLKLMKL